MAAEELARSQQFGGFSNDMEGHEVRSKVHQFTLLKAPKEVAEKLRVAESATSAVPVSWTGSPMWWSIPICPRISSLGSQRRW